MKISILKFVVVTVGIFFFCLNVVYPLYTYIPIPKLKRNGNLKTSTSETLPTNQPVT